RILHIRVFLMPTNASLVAGGSIQFLGIVRLIWLAPYSPTLLPKQEIFAQTGHLKRGIDTSARAHAHTALIVS
ncbi:MAG: hypothetical protein LBQ49_02945, partial [Rickettsiales bacterium]|nr:hypothetical protein [Rickettsiales bacterium]